MYTQEIEHPIVDLNRLGQDRAKGLSGIMRLRNEEEYLAASIESWLPILDELVIVYNNCQDKTGDIVERYAALYPNKIKAYHYLPIVYPPGSRGFRDEPETSYHSLCNYYNYALIQTSYACAVKVDGDLIVPNDEVRDRIRKSYDRIQSEPHLMQPLSGINVLLDKNRGVMVPTSSKYCALYGDLGIFRVLPGRYFIKSGDVEALKMDGLTLLPRIFAYYHLKFARRDFGIANYDLQSNKDSVYLPKTWVFLWHLKLEGLENVLGEIDYQLPMPDTSGWNAPSHSDYRKSAMSYLWKSHRSLGSWSLLVDEELGYWTRNGRMGARLARFLQKVKRKLNL